MSPTHDLSWIYNKPFAHRGLHDASRHIYENSLGACAAAVKHGFSIEVDLHFSSDGQPVVFHDDQLQRMCGDPRDVRDLSADELAQLRLGKSDDHVPSLRELLTLVDGKVGLVLELKGVIGRDEGFVKAVAADLETYAGPCLIMSFNHWLLDDARADAPHLPLGLTAMGDNSYNNAHMEIARRCDIDFVSYGFNDLPCQFTDTMLEEGKPLISWTIRDAQQYARAVELGASPTFEGFLP